MPPSASTGTSATLRIAIVIASVGVAVAAVTVAGCSSTPHTASAPLSAANPSTALAASATPSSSVRRSPPGAAAPQPARPLTRAAFVTRTNALCRVEQAQAVQAGNELTGLSSVDGFVDGTVAIITTNARKFIALVAAQPDRRVLQARWLVPRLKDYATEEKLLARLRADADRGNGAVAQTDLTALKNMPNHNATVNPFLKAYGLTACA